jgi:hypothetical protein
MAVRIDDNGVGTGVNSDILSLRGLAALRVENGKGATLGRDVETMKSWIKSQYI